MAKKTDTHNKSERAECRQETETGPGEGSGKSTEGRGKAKRTECTKIIGFSSSRRLQQLNEKKTIFVTNTHPRDQTIKKGRKIYSRKSLVKLNL